MRANEISSAKPQFLCKFKSLFINGKKFRKQFAKQTKFKKAFCNSENASPTGIVR